jgi:thiol-disulfide isomerase/thioredoxin
MKRLLSRDTLLFGLALLALGQLLVFGHRWRNRDGPADSWLHAGDDVSTLQFRTPSGRSVSTAGGGTMVLLIFDSQCPHCRAVAPAWQAWIEEVPPGLRVVGVSTEPPETAQAFAQEQGWGVEVWQVEARTGSPEHALTSRTPWVFLLDGQGRILKEGHGSRLAELTSGVSDFVAEASVR